MQNEWITQVVQSGVAVAVLIWIVQMGNAQMQRLYTDHTTQTDRLISTLIERNKQLTDALITCVSAINASRPCPDNDPS